MTDLPEIASLWIGGKLSFLEQLCIQSYIDAGHKFSLYCYEDVAGVPKGANILDARELYRGEPFHIHHKHETPAIHADYFRIKLMLRGRGEIWVDTDAYCYRPFDFKEDHVFGLLDGGVANGVMRLPSNSAALRAYEELLFSKEPMPPFFHPSVQSGLKLLRGQGFYIPLEAMTWGATGPMALNHFLQKSGEIEHALPQHIFYPAGWKERRKFLRPREKYFKNVREDTVSFHFYGRIVRRILSEEFNSIPAPKSILEELCEKHNIDTRAAPIEWTRPHAMVK